MSVVKEIHWDDGLSVGIKKLDEDHKYLIELINQLIQLVDDHADLKLIHELIDQLEKFTYKHSQREEALIAKCSTDLLDEQKAGHIEFSQLMVDMRALIGEGEHDRDESLIEMTESLVRWLIQHIIEQDLNLEPVFRLHNLSDMGVAPDPIPPLPFFQKMSFIRGLEILVGVSLLPMLVFAGILIYSGWQQLQLSRSIISLAGFSEVTGNIIHELQKERGATSGFLASEGFAFDSVLKRQRRLSDLQVIQFVNQTQLLAEEGLFPGVVLKASEVAARLGDFRAHRTTVDTNEVTPIHGIEFYTKLIDQLIVVAQMSSSLALDADVHKTLTAYSMLVALKESAGLERAIGAAAFIQRGLSEKNYLAYVGLVAGQKILTQQLQATMSPVQWVAWNKVFDEANLKEHHRLREIVLQTGIRSISVDINSLYWFEVATQRIDHMMHFERDLIGVMLKNAREAGNINSALFVISMFGAALMVFIIGYTAIQLTRSIRQPILNLTHGMKALRKGDKTVRVPFLERGDELGDMVRSYESFRRKLIKAEMFSQNQELGVLVASRHALELRRRTEQGEKYRKLAAIDRLTGVLNRGEFYQRASAEIKRAKRHGAPFSVLLLDLDFFKQVNDSYGHAMGDEVLRRFAKETSTLLRDQDLLGRVGGEEFAILLVETTLDPAEQKAEKIRVAIEGLEFYFKGDIFNISVSIGVGQYGVGEDKLDPLMERADRALYQAKGAGRNRVESYHSIMG